MGAVSSGSVLPRGGSLSKTSTAAPAMIPLFRASARSRDTTTGPRAMFTRMAVGFILARAWLSISPRVESFRGQWRATMSDFSRTSSIDTCRI